MSIYFEPTRKWESVACVKLSFLNLIFQMSLSKAMMWYSTFFDKMVENMNNIWNASSFIKQNLAALSWHESLNSRPALHLCPNISTTPLYSNGVFNHVYFSAVQNQKGKHCRYIWVFSAKNRCLDTIIRNMNKTLKPCPMWKSVT